MVGIRPLGFSARYHSSFCSPLLRAIGRTVYGKPNSSMAIETFQPLGVAAVYNSSMMCLHTSATMFSMAFCQHCRCFLFDHRAGEEIRIRLTPKPDRISKHKIAEVVFTDEPVFYKLVRLRYDVRHVWHVEVPDIRTKQCAQPRSERIVLSIERPRIHTIISLTAEVEVVHKEVSQVFR